MGRDKFSSFCREHQLLVPKTKRYFITTNSNHHYLKSPNLVKSIDITHSEQVWVTDITYIKLDGKHAYLALVTDLYSKKIMGYCIDDNMKVSLVKSALEMAVKSKSTLHKNIIHHSDRGIQYCCPDYVEFASKKGMIMSTTEKYDPYENAVAERINETIKYEFGMIRTIPNLRVAKKMLQQAVDIYNNERRHCSLQMQTPQYAHIHQNHSYKSYKKVKVGKEEQRTNDENIESSLSTPAQRTNTKVNAGQVVDKVFEKIKSTAPIFEEISNQFL
jgi:transposase InsO family protein